MIEIHVRIKIDTNDPREAYLQAMGALAFSGHEHVVSDYWLINGKPLPKQVAQNVRQCNGQRKVTQCVIPAEPRDPMEDWLDKYAGNVPVVYRAGSDAMRAFNALVLGVPVERPRCIHNEVDFDVSADETPMFRAMFTDDDGVDFDTGPAWGNKPGATYIDFDVGTAEEIPLSALDVEIYDLMNTLVPK